MPVQKGVNAKAVNANLMFALKHNAPDFVELYLQRGANPCEVSFCHRPLSVLIDMVQLMPTYEHPDGKWPFSWQTFLAAVDELYKVC